MRELDCLNWASGFAFTSFGLSIGLRVNISDIPNDVMLCMPPGWQLSEENNVDHLLSLWIGKSGKTSHVLHAGEKEAIRTRDWDTLLYTLEHEFEEYLAVTAREHVFVHAGVVTWKGRAVVLPGRSRAGKSTLVAALLEAGATYFSDEFAVLDAHGRVHPYARRLSLRRPGGTDRVPAETLGVDIGSDPAQVGMVVRTEYRPGAEWRPHRLSPGQALMELANHTRPEAAQSTRGQDTLSRFAESIPTYKGPRGDAAVCAREILRALETPRLEVPVRLYS
jgi:hypothetical protein